LSLPSIPCFWEDAVYKITSWLPTQRSLKATKRQCGSDYSSSKKEKKEQGRRGGKGA